MFRLPYFCAALSILFAATAVAETIDPVYTQMALYGISRDDGTLKRYGFNDNALSTVGVVADASGQAFTGIQAAAYIRGHLNMLAFWTDPADGRAKIVYVNLKTGLGTVVGSDLGDGSVGGATVVDTGLNGKNRWAVYVVHHVEQIACQHVSLGGKININPNNSPQNEFTLNYVDSQGNEHVITRDDLHQNSPINGDGTFYQGSAYRVRVKPKGNGNQNDLTVNGEAFGPAEQHDLRVQRREDRSRVQRPQAQQRQGHGQVVDRIELRKLAGARGR